MEMDNGNLEAIGICRVQGLGWLVRKGGMEGTLGTLM